jgi:hypothetical protein
LTYLLWLGECVWGGGGRTHQEGDVCEGEEGGGQGEGHADMMLCAGNEDTKVTHSNNTPGAA